MRKLTIVWIFVFALALATSYAAVPQRGAYAQCIDPKTKAAIPCDKQKKVPPTPIPPTATSTATATPTSTPTPTPTSAPTSTPTPTATATALAPAAASGGAAGSKAADGVSWPVWTFYLGALAVSGAFIYLGSRLKALQRDVPSPDAAHVPGPVGDGFDKYSLFLPDGTPMRGTAHVAMKSSGNTGEDSGPAGIDISNMTIEDAVEYMFMLTSNDARQDMHDELSEMERMRRRKAAIRESIEKLRRQSKGAPDSSPETGDSSGDTNADGDPTP